MARTASKEAKGVREYFPVSWVFDPERESLGMPEREYYNLRDSYEYRAGNLARKMFEHFGDADRAKLKPEEILDGFAETFKREYSVSFRKDCLLSDFILKGEVSSFTASVIAVDVISRFGVSDTGPVPSLVASGAGFLVEFRGHFLDAAAHAHGGVFPATHLTCAPGQIFGFDGIVGLARRNIHVAELARIPGKLD